MIRHPLVSGSVAGAVAALMIAMIGAAFRRLLMATVGGAALRPARLRTAGQTAIDLPAFAGGADEEDAAAWTNALAKRRGTKSMHQRTRAGWTVLVRHTENADYGKGALRSAQPPDEKTPAALKAGVTF